MTIDETREAVAASTDELIAWLEQDRLPQDCHLVELFRRARGEDIKAIEWFRTQMDIILDYIEKS